MPSPTPTPSRCGTRNTADCQKTRPSGYKAGVPPWPGISVLLRCGYSLALGRERRQCRKGGLRPIGAEPIPSALRPITGRPSPGGRNGGQWSVSARLPTSSTFSGLPVVLARTCEAAMPARNPSRSLPSPDPGSNFPHCGASRSASAPSVSKPRQISTACRAVRHRGLLLCGCKRFGMLQHLCTMRQAATSVSASIPATGWRRVWRSPLSPKDRDARLLHAEALGSPGPPRASVHYPLLQNAWGSTACSLRRNRWRCTRIVPGATPRASAMRSLPCPAAARSRMASCCGER